MTSGSIEHGWKSSDEVGYFFCQNCHVCTCHTPEEYGEPCSKMLGL